MKKLKGILSPLAGLEELEQMVARVKEGPGQLLVYGIGGSQKPYLTAGLFAASGRSCLYITANLQEAHQVYDDLVNFLPPERVLLFPPLEVLPYDFEARSQEVTARRVQVLEKLCSIDLGQEIIIVAPVTAVQGVLPPAEILEQVRETLRVGTQIPWDELLERLVWLGYERVDLIGAKGQFAVRGSILDIFPLTAENPFRIEFFDDEIESIREFVVEGQRSQQDLEQVAIPPAREFILTSEVRKEGLARLKKRGQEACSHLQARGRGALARKLAQRLEQYQEQAQGAVYFAGIDHLLPLFFEGRTTLVDYLPPASVVVLDEPSRLMERTEEFINQVGESFGNLLEEGRVFPFQMENYLSWEQVAQSWKGLPLVSLALFLKAIPGINPDTLLPLTVKEVPAYHGKRELVTGDLRRWRQQQYSVLVLAATGDRARRIQEFIGEGDGLEPVVEQENPQPVPGKITIGVGTIHKGFEFPKQKIVLLGERDILGRQKTRSFAPTKSKGQGIRTLTDLDPGSLVVHVNHGIGRYLGMETLEVQGVQRDYLLVQYAGEDRLYVPTDQVHLLQKYVGLEGHSPRLNKLGGSDWNRVKGRVKKSVQELAQGLLQLYAARETIPGHAHTPDTLWQQEFESTFPFEETPDQKAAIEAVKRSMEEPKPMDHVVCGDVGYGKTEVAIRAAFKAVMDGKQVAVLVPTTILAQQHYHTFRERFADYPVTIGLLSRFRTPAQQRATLQGLKRGTVDVVIGTHRLLQQDIKFKDLGLLVIDEEQRFGVSQKEILKKMRESVDVLTLTATPIPRTLHMALAGIRDMSLIETAPENRYPVQTYVLEHDYNLVRDAIAQELHRGGQVFYVHNRVETIQRETKRIRELCPQARVVAAHGQMGERELEEIVLGFLEGEYDVLVCTTIIENGLDMPNVNTLIVKDADKMGLAQLYQLRGRVGRSDRLAYAYFTYQKNKVLSGAAEKRLQALREFTELGSGFKLALRDLEIRGAGNLLGAEQHGHIADIGFELYCRLLEDAVRQLKGESREVEVEPNLDLNINAYIPGEYIPDGRQKIEIYKAVAAARTTGEVEELEEEVSDRFGSIPRVVKNLLDVARVKAFAREAGVEGVVQREDKVSIEFSPKTPVPLQEVFTSMRQYRRRVAVNAGGKPRVILRASDLTEEALLENLLEILSKIASLAGEDSIQYNRSG